MAEFYLDDDVSEDLADLLRVLGHDAVHSRRLWSMSRIDPRQLAVATEQGRVLVTANFRDYKMLHEAWLIWAPILGGTDPVPHPGIVAVPNPNVMDAPAMADLLDEFARSMGAGDIRNRLFRWRRSTGWEDLSAVR